MLHCIDAAAAHLATLCLLPETYTKRTERGVVGTHSAYWSQRERNATAFPNLEGYARSQIDKMLSPQLRHLLLKHGDHAGLPRQPDEVDVLLLRKPEVKSRHDGSEVGMPMVFADKKENYFHGDRGDRGRRGGGQEDVAAKSMGEVIELLD